VRQSRAGARFGAGIRLPHPRCRCQFCLIGEARRRIADTGLEGLISVETGDAAQRSEWPSCDAALCLGAAFIWGHIGDAAAALGEIVGGGGAIAVGEPFWRETGRAGRPPSTTTTENGFVDLTQTVARFEAAGVDLTGMVAASEDDWDRYTSLQWRAAVEIGGDEVMERHLSRRENYLNARRAELGWAIFTGRVR
jgi:hypothetical protein